MLLLAERHPDWSVNFIEGIEPGWWHESEEGSGVPISSLLPPEAWQQVLIDEGFADCDVFFESAAEGLAEGAYLLLAKRPLESVVALPTPKAAVWLLLADETSRPLADHLRLRLESLGQHITVNDRLESAAACDHVVHMLGWADTTETGILGSLSSLLEDARHSRPTWETSRRLAASHAAERWPPDCRSGPNPARRNPPSGDSAASS